MGKDYMKQMCARVDGKVGNVTEDDLDVGKMDLPLPPSPPLLLCVLRLFLLGECRAVLALAGSGAASRLRLSSSWGGRLAGGARLSSRLVVGRRCAHLVVHCALE